MSDNPWAELTPARSAFSINVKRVDANCRWHFFWALDVEGRALLLLKHQGDPLPFRLLPQLKGIEVASQAGPEAGQSLLTFTLLDFAQRDLFFRLCTDIVQGTYSAEGEEDALRAALSRTWRWHHLLRGGVDDGLSLEEQKGLIGELLVLERHLLPRLAAEDAISAWRGPFNAPKDFEVGRICIEAKARRGAASPFITISSEHQLDDSEVDALFLHVVSLAQDLNESSIGFTVTDIAERMHDRIAVDATGALQPFCDALSAAGFDFDQNYEDSRWLEGSSVIYRVGAAFPRITSHAVSTGVMNVQYSISLLECEAFRITLEELDRTLTGAPRGEG